MKELFVGRIVCWPNQFDEGDEEKPVILRVAGYGEVIAVLDETEEPQLLVRKLPTKNYPEPVFMFLLGLLTPDLQFFDSIYEYENWLNFTLTSEPAEIVRLVRKGER